MGDPWELLDRAMNVEGLIEAIIEGGIAGYVIYKNREMLKQIAAKTARRFKIIEPPDVVVQMKPAKIAAQSKAVASLTVTPTVSRRSPSALEKLLEWYLRIASS
jgi:hypothetical protein